MAVAAPNSLLTSARAFGHFIEQPMLIRKIAVGTGIAGLLGVGGLVANDLTKAQPGKERQKILIRDAVVLGTTAIGTILATKRLMPLPSREAGFQEIAKLLQALKDHGQKYANLLQLEAFSQGKAQLSQAEFKQIVSTIKTRGGKDELNAILPVGGDMTEVKAFQDQVRDMARRSGQTDSAGRIMEDDGELVTMARFFTVGLASVLSGLTGGILANKINKVNDPAATANMAKEGCFQFIANIALCAVGASIALVLMKIPQIAKQIAKLGALSKVVRTIGIMIGLCLGIFGGGIIANFLGQRYINPLIDRMNGKVTDPKAPQGGKRRIEFADAILHLDDLPTALAIAGFAAVEPILPWFFAFSGYRTGIGYRNDHHHGAKQTPKTADTSAIPQSGTLTLGSIHPANMTPQPTWPMMAASNPMPIVYPTAAAYRMPTQMPMSTPGMANPTPLNPNIFRLP